MHRGTLMVAMIRGVLLACGLCLAACGGEEEGDCVDYGERCASTSQCCGDMICEEAELPGVYRCS